MDRAAYAAESAAQIAERQSDVARLGASAALHHWIGRKTQGAFVLHVLTDDDFAMWDAHWPAPATTEAP
jgi:hypothetical protein